MKVYKNGVLAGTKTDGYDPIVLTRTQNWLGRSLNSNEGYFDGTIAYLKVWHGVELQAQEIASMYPISDTTAPTMAPTASPTASPTNAPTSAPTWDPVPPPDPPTPEHFYDFRTPTCDPFTSTTTASTDSGASTSTSTPHTAVCSGPCYCNVKGLIFPSSPNPSSSSTSQTLLTPFVLSSNFSVAITFNITSQTETGSQLEGHLFDAGRSSYSSLPRLSLTVVYPSDTIDPSSTTPTQNANAPSLELVVSDTSQAVVVTGLEYSKEYRAVVTVSKTEFALHLGGEKYSAPLQNPLSGDDLYDPIELGTENFSGSIAHLTFWRITISDRQAKHLDAPPPPFVYSSPVAVISAPSSVGSCASFTVDGSGSTSSGGANDLQYSWELDGAALVNSTTYLLNFHLDSNPLSPGTHVVTLIVDSPSALLQSQPSSASFEVSSQNTPVVEFSPFSLPSPGSELEIEATAVIFECGSGSTAVAASGYSYAVATNDGIIHTASNSRNLILPPYTFLPNDNVTIFLNVSEISTGLTTSVLTSFKVPHGQVIAEIADGDRTNPAGATLTLDGSASRDTGYEDGGTSTLQYSWACHDVTNSSDITSIPVNPSQHTYALFSPPWSPQIPVGQTYLFTLTVTAPDGRQDSDHVRITQGDSIIPGLALESVQNHNAGDKFTLRATVDWEGAEFVTYSWSVTDPSTGSTLSSASFNAPSTGALSEPGLALLVLLPGALHPGTTYIATLTAAFSSTSKTSTSSLTFIVNGPPSGGVLTVDIPSGEAVGSALTTLYDLRALNWFDPDGGLSYWFGYLSPSSDIQQLQDWSGSPSASAYLPSGNITLVTRVKDIHGAVANSTTGVFVQQPASISAAMAVSSNLFEEALVLGDEASALAIIASTAEVLKSVDCSAAPSCASLNRLACGDAAGYSKSQGGTNACGDCLDGYSGITGPVTTDEVCTEFVPSCENGALDSDESDIDCGGICKPCMAFQDCAANSDCISGTCEGGVCLAERKRCPTSVAQTDCSGRGTCTYRDYNGEPVPFCAASNELCTAICDCSSGYAGEGCQWSQVEKDELAAARLELLMGVSDVQESEATMEAARTSALAQASVVKDLVSRPDELSEQSVQLAVELLDNIASVRLAAENDERQANVDLATAVSSIISAQAKDVSNYTLNNIVDSIVSKVAYLELNMLVEGETASEVVTENIRMSSVVVKEGAVKTGEFKAPGENATVFSFPEGTPDGGPSGISVAMWGKNPHSSAGDANGTLSVVSAVTKLTVTSISGGGRRRLTGDTEALSNQNMTVAIETPIDPSLSEDSFAEAKVELSGQVNCTRGVEELKLVECLGVTYGYQCDGEKDELNRIDCLSGSVVPVCGMYDQGSNSWMTENCVQVPSEDANTVKCKCFFDSGTVNPDFTAMAATVGKSFKATLSVGFNHLFSVASVSENPTMFYTLGGMTLLAVLLTYRGYQLDLKDKDAEGKRIYLEYNMSQLDMNRQKSIEKRDEEKRLKAIEELKKSDNEAERSRGLLMERDMKKESKARLVLQKIGGTSSNEAQQVVETQDSAKRKWSVIKKVGLGQHLKNTVHKHLAHGENEAGSIFGAMMGKGAGMRIARHVKDSTPQFITLKRDKVGLFSKSVVQFHSLFFLLAKKFHGDGMDRPTKVAFVYMNLINVMFVTALTYELQAGSKADVCSQFDDTSFDECTLGGGMSPFDSSMSRCVFEFAGRYCVDRPLGEDAYKIGIFLSFFTSILTLPLSFLVKKLFFKGILPPSIQAIKDANKKYIAMVQQAKEEDKDHHLHDTVVNTWERQCITYREKERAQKMKDKGDFAEYGIKGLPWAVLPHFIKRKFLNKRRNKRKAHAEVIEVFQILVERRQEILNALANEVAADEEAFRLDLLLLSLGAEKHRLSAKHNKSNGGKRTREMDLVRARFALEEFDSLFGKGFEEICKLFPNLKDQKVVLTRVWERWRFFRFHEVKDHDKVKEMKSEGMTVGYSVLTKFRWFRVRVETSYWASWLEKHRGDLPATDEATMEGAPTNLELARALAEVEESIHRVYFNLKFDLQMKTDLERSLMVLPETKKATRIMEYYNMGGLGKFERLIFKLNMINSKTLPLATQEFMKYVFWAVVIGWTGFCIFYLLSFAVRHGDETIRLWLMAFFFGWIQKIIFNEPQMILLKHVVLPLVFVGTLEHGLSSTSTWQLKYHVFAHSNRLGVERVPVGGAYRVAMDRPDLVTSRYILAHANVPTPLRDRSEYGGDSKDAAGTVTEKTNSVDSYFDAIEHSSEEESFKKVGLFRKEDAREEARKSINSMISQSKSAVKAKYAVFEESLNRGTNSNDKCVRWFYLFFGWFLIIAALLLLLDELEMGDLALAGFQAGIIWISNGSNRGWIILGCTVAPVVVGVALALLYHLGLLKLAGDLLGSSLRKTEGDKRKKRENSKSKILWDYVVSSSGLLQAVKERERVHFDYEGNEIREGDVGSLPKGSKSIYTESIAHAVAMWIWRYSILEWTWNGVAEWFRSVRRDGLGATITNGFVVRGVARVWRAFKDFVKGDGDKIHILYEKTEDDKDKDKDKDTGAAVKIPWDPKKVKDSEVVDCYVDLVEELVEELVEPARKEVRADLQEQMQAKLAEEERISKLTAKLMSIETAVDKEEDDDFRDWGVSPLASTTHSLAQTPFQNRNMFFGGDEGSLGEAHPIDDDHALLDGGYDSDKTLEQKAMEFKVPTPHKKGSLRMKGPPRMLTPKAGGVGQVGKWVGEGGRGGDGGMKAPPRTLTPKAGGVVQVGKWVGEGGKGGDGGDGGDGGNFDDMMPS
ncbi:hypothetical protein TrST_g2369 [Triparma strigata]|nr:hypothetical protein TrST_g2369 [Triparma strigata]